MPLINNRSQLDISLNLKWRYMSIMTYRYIASAASLFVQQTVQADI